MWGYEVQEGGGGGQLAACIQPRGPLRVPKPCVKLDQGFEGGAVSRTHSPVPPPQVLPRRAIALCVDALQASPTAFHTRATTHAPGPPGPVASGDGRIRIVRWPMLNPIPRLPYASSR